MARWPLNTIVEEHRQPAALRELELQLEELPLCGRVAELEAVGEGAGQHFFKEGGGKEMLGWGPGQLPR